MLEAIVTGTLTIFQPDILMLIVIGVVIGLLFGILPGLGGIVALAILTPLIYDMERVHALTFLLAVHSVVYSGGAVTAILLNIPGTSPNAATLIDGFPLTKKGKSGQALGAAFVASMLGGCFGAFVLAALIPVVSSVVMVFGSPETFFFGILALSFIAIISRESTLKGLVSGGLGILLSFVGYQGLTGVPRFTFGSLYLYDGIKLIPLVLGLFAIPTVLELATKGKALAQVERPRTAIKADLVEGIQSALRHWWLVLRCSAIGCVVGIIPGVGGETAPFVAYGYAKQTSKHSEEFGSGHIEGVIAPESANNAKEGGALLPTLAFGIPGSASMAILLGAFLIVGLTPGPALLTDHADIVFSLIATLVLANVLACILILLLTNSLAKIAFVRAPILFPVILILITVGAFSTETNISDLFMMLLLGAFGWAMKSLGFNLPALLLGFVLGQIVETNLYISLGAYGSTFFLRPISMVLIALTLGGLFYTRRSRQRGAPASSDPTSVFGFAFTLLLFAIFLSGLSFSLQYSPRAMLGPWVIGIPMIGLLSRELYSQTKQFTWAQVKSELRPGQYASSMRASLSILCLVLGIYLVGFTFVIPVFTVVYMRIHKESWMLSLSLALLLSLTIHFLFAQLLSVPLYPGILLGGSTT